MRETEQKLTKTFKFRTTKEHAELLRMEAKSNDISVSDLLRQMTDPATSLSPFIINIHKNLDSNRINNRINDLPLPKATKELIRKELLGND